MGEIKSRHFVLVTALVSLTSIAIFSLIFSIDGGIINYIIGAIILIVGYAFGKTIGESLRSGENKRL